MPDSHGKEGMGQLNVRPMLWLSPLTSPMTLSFSPGWAVCMKLQKKCAVHQACAGVAKPNSMLLVKWQHFRNEVVFIWNTLWRINNGRWDGYKGWEEATIANVFSLYWMLKWCMYMMTLELLTHCGLVTPHGDIDLCHNWLRYWLVAWWHQAITWTSVD